MPRKPLEEAIYIQAIEAAFLANYEEGATEVLVLREDLLRAGGELGVDIAKNLGDILYTYRYRADMPEAIARTAPPGTAWIILGAGRGKYRFEARPPFNLTPNPMLAETRIPDSTPGVIARYALSDEQALLARLRYNRLLDIFTGTACYSLQNHLRTYIRNMGQVETDEVYIGVDRHGAHYVIPVQAKRKTDRLSLVQVLQDIALAKQSFPNLICRPIAAQFTEDGEIALFALEEHGDAVQLLDERHYRLVPHQELTEEELATYRARAE